MELFGLEDIISDGMEIRSLDSSEMMGFLLVGIAKLPVSLTISFPRMMSMTGKVKESGRR